MSDDARIKYAACYRASTGILHPANATESAIRERAQESVDHLNRQTGTDEYVLGQAPMYPWSEAH